MSAALRLWRRFGGSGAGRWLCSRLVCLRAPYFASIAPRLELLEPGRCVATMKQRRRVQNHLGTVHAIALCNLAEFAGGLATDASTPAGMRWIPKGMRVRYLRKALGRLTATATVPPIEGAEPREVETQVIVADSGGEPVFDATITMWVSPARAG